MTLALGYLIAWGIVAASLTLCCVLIFIDLMAAFRADYGWPWRQRPGGNGRSRLDLRVTLWAGVFAAVGLLLLGAVVWTIADRRDEVRITPLGMGLMVLFALGAIFSFDVWRLARRERRDRG